MLLLELWTQKCEEASFFGGQKDLCATGCITSKAGRASGPLSTVVRVEQWLTFFLLTRVSKELVEADFSENLSSV